MKRHTAYIDKSGNIIPCIQGRRNRIDKITRGSVVMDSEGNISHPPISKLACFGNPVEYYRGTSDTEATYKGVATPRWCAGCKSRPACAETASNRVDADPDLVSKRDAWEVATDRLTPVARYEHPTFTEFASACDDRNWTSTNEDALEAQRGERAKQTRKKRDRTKRKAKQAKPIPPAMLQAIDHERELRHKSLKAAKVEPGAPPWLRNLNAGSIELTCDVWRTLTLLDHQYNGAVSGGDVMRALMFSNRYSTMTGGFRARVSEAMKRVRRLEISTAGTPVWGDPFDLVIPNAPRSGDGGLDGVVWQVLDDP